MHGQDEQHRIQRTGFPPTPVDHAQASGIPRLVTVLVTLLEVASRFHESSIKNLQQFRQLHASSDQKVTGSSPVGRATQLQGLTPIQKQSGEVAGSLLAHPSGPLPCPLDDARLSESLRSRTDCGWRRWLCFSTDSEVECTSGRVASRSLGRVHLQSPAGRRRFLDLRERILAAYGAGPH